MRSYEKFLLNKYKLWINITYNYSFIIFPFISFFHFLPKKRGCVALCYLAYAINNLFSSYDMFQNDTSPKLYNENIISLSIKLEDRYFCLQCLPFQQTKLVISASPTNLGGWECYFHFILFFGEVMLPVMQTCNTYYLSLYKTVSYILHS